MGQHYAACSSEAEAQNWKWHKLECEERREEFQSDRVSSEVMVLMIPKPFIKHLTEKRGGGGGGVMANIKSQTYILRHADMEKKNHHLH